jgi:hypothetical protein
MLLILLGSLAVILVLLTGIYLALVKRHPQNRGLLLVIFVIVALGAAIMLPKVLGGLL